MDVDVYFYGAARLLILSRLDCMIASYMDGVEFIHSFIAIVDVNFD
jgi:hypothetical protein